MGIISTESFKKIKDPSGFTLVELLVAIAMFGIITALIVSNYSRQSQTSTSQNQVVEVQQNVRAALYILEREIRKAGYDPDENDNHGIINAGTGLTNTAADALSFTYDDDTGAEHTATINLFDSSIDISASIDEIQITASGQPIAENIANNELNQPLFEYFDGDGNSMGNSVATENLGDIRMIQVTIIARPDENERCLPKDYRTLTSLIKCRNLGL